MLYFTWRKPEASEMFCYIRWMLQFARSSGAHHRTDPQAKSAVIINLARARWRVQTNARAQFCRKKTANLVHPSTTNITHVHTRCAGVTLARVV